MMLRVVLLAGMLVAWLSMRQIGGQTGDVLGALQQLSEALILLIGTVALKSGI